jgi:hypothetical protein
MGALSSYVRGHRNPNVWGKEVPMGTDLTPVMNEAFAATWEQFTSIVAFLADPSSGELTHAELEQRLEVDARKAFRQAMQDHADLRAVREQRLGEVIGADLVARNSAEPGHERTLGTVFGEVVVSRLAYRARGYPNLHPSDATLNLPAEKHSHGLRRLAAIEATRGSFDAAAAAIERATGQSGGKRQIQDLAARAAADVDDFYQTRTPPADAGTDILGLSADGKGIVMSPKALREPTAKAAKSRKLSTRLSPGEKTGRKRMAEVGAVFDATAAPRTPADVMTAPGQPRGERTPGPKARNKWLTASVSDDAAQVITAVFDEAERRDPGHARTWVALVDGNNHQINRIRAEARHRKITVPIVIDFIHVIEYLWKAAWCFFPTGDPKAETWVTGHATAILSGNASTVAAAIRRKATYHGLDPGTRKPADTCATYLLNKKKHLDYPTALAQGWPIATGVIEGACRHLVADRMDITGARWGLTNAEAVLKLRAVTSNGDFNDYWTYHLSQEQQRVHNARYLGEILPT